MLSYVAFSFFSLVFVFINLALNLHYPEILPLPREINIMILIFSYISIIIWEIHRYRKWHENFKALMWFIFGMGLSYSLSCFAVYYRF